MRKAIPIKITDGLELVPMGPSIASVRVTNPEAKSDLSWDRFIRLKAAADAVLETNAQSVLDVGGYDGALAFFLPNLSIDVIDSVTTGGTILDLAVEEDSYETVVAVDVLEHIEPKSRAKALSELARVAKNHLILNYPCQDSKEAQKLVLSLTKNPLIKEHVDWELPDSQWVLTELANYDFTGIVRAHGSVAVWLGQYVTLNLLPEAAKELNRHLVGHHADEPCSTSLYHLVVCTRRQ